MIIMKKVNTTKEKNAFWRALFSKYPIINKGYVQNEIRTQGNSNFCIYADIVKKKDTLGFTMFIYNP